MDVTSPQNINTDNIGDNVCVSVLVNIKLTHLMYI